MWEQLWTTPQACAWAQEPWRQYDVGQYVRWSVKAEASDASAGLIAGVLRLKVEIGLGDTGLKVCGWKIAAEEPAAEEKPSAASNVTDIKSRLASGGA